MSSEENLTNELNEYLKANNLPISCALELQMFHDLTASQRIWLDDFSDRWEEAVK